MYSIGDRIVYPMHGAGIIKKMEEKKILGEIRQYYILDIPCGDMKIMVPVGNADEVGIRPVVEEGAFDGVIGVLKDPSSEMSGNWNRRYRENMEKLKTGDIFEVAEVVRNLIRIDRVKKLSTGEKKMLSNAKHILISEMVLIKDIDPDYVTELIEEVV